MLRQVPPLSPPPNSPAIDAPIPPDAGHSATDRPHASEAVLMEIRLTKLIAITANSCKVRGNPTRQKKSIRFARKNVEGRAYTKLDAAPRSFTTPSSFVITAAT